VPGRPLLILHRVQPNHVDQILNNISDGKLPPARPSSADRRVGSPHRTREVRLRLSGNPQLERDPVLQRQVKIVLRNCGLINPDDIEEYIAIGGTRPSTRS